MRRAGPAATAATLSLLSTLAAWLLYGYNFGLSSNHAFYLPWVLSVLDPSLFPGDPAVIAVGGMPSFFWHLFAVLAELVGVEPGAGLLWAAGRVVAFWATYRAARVLGASALSAGLAPVFVLASRTLFISSPLAGDPMLKVFLDQTSFAWPLALWAVVFWLDGRRRHALLGLGLLANLNLLVAAITALWLILAGWMQRGRSVRSSGREAALFLLGAAPILAVVLARGCFGDAAIMTVASPLTYLPGRWPAERLVEAAAFLLLWLAVCRAHPRAPTLVALLRAGCALWAATLICGWVPALRPALGLQLNRLDVAVGWLAAVAGAGVAAAGLRARAPGRLLSALAAAWAFLCVSVTPPLALWGAGMVVLGGARRRLAAWAFLGAFYGTASLAAETMPFSLPPSAALITVLLGSLAAAGALAGRAGLSMRSRTAILGLAAVLAAVGPAEVILTRERFNAHIQAGGVEEWARSTATDALFIVTPGTSGFRLRARRAVFAEWTDFNLALWDGRAARKWRARMAALGVAWEPFSRRWARELRVWDRDMLRGRPGAPPAGFLSWQPSDSRRLSALARRAGASYIVAPAAAGIRLPIVYAADGKAVYLPVADGT